VSPIGSPSCDPGYRDGSDTCLWPVVRGYCPSCREWLLEAFQKHAKGKMTQLTFWEFVDYLAPARLRKRRGGEDDT
jgi:hypothetical protein